MLNMANEVYVDGRMAYQDGSEDMRRLLRLVTGHECIPCEGSTGQSANDPWQEGDVAYYDCEDRRGHTLSYCFEDMGDGLCKVFDVQVLADERWDGEFDLTHDRLRRTLADIASDGFDHETLLRVGGKFGIAF